MANSRLVFICAWNEEASIASVIEELHQYIPDADVLVIDDGSSDKTAQRAKQCGAEVVSFSVNRGLKSAIAEGYHQALSRGYQTCGRVDADGQHRPEDLLGMFEAVESGRCDVAIGSRFLPDSGEYVPEAERVVGTAILRALLRLRLGSKISDGTSGMYVVNSHAMRLLAIPYDVGAPEVQGILRLSDAELKILEVPVHMRQREHGESSFVGKRAIHLVVSVAGALLVGEGLRRRRRRQSGNAAG